MKPPSIHRQTGLLSAAIVALIGLCLIWALAGQSHSAAASRAFDSPLRPTHTPKPTRTSEAGVSPTPTLGAFVSPLSTRHLRAICALVISLPSASTFLWLLRIQHPFPPQGHTAGKVLASRGRPQRSVSMPRRRINSGALPRTGGTIGATACATSLRNRLPALPAHLLSLKRVLRTSAMFP